MTELQARDTSRSQIRRAWALTESEKFDGFTLAEVDARYVRLDNAWNRFADNCYKLIENAQDSEEKQEHERMYEETEETYFETRTRLREKELQLRRDGESTDPEQSEDETRAMPKFKLAKVFHQHSKPCGNQHCNKHSRK